MIRSRLAPALSVAIFLLAGCHKKTEGSFTDGEGKTGSYAVEQSGDGATTTVKTADGTAVIHSGGGTQDALPPGLALYPGATVTSDMLISKEAGKKAGVLTFESGDAPDALTAFYKKAAAKAGYAVDHEMKTGDAQLLSGKKADGISFHLSISREGSLSKATLLAGAEG